MAKKKIKKLKVVFADVIPTPSSLSNEESYIIKYLEVGKESYEYAFASNDYSEIRNSLITYFDKVNLLSLSIEDLNKVKQATNKDKKLN